MNGKIKKINLQQKKTIPQEILDLLEPVARRVHECWTQKRLAEGWTYGKERNDAAKTHPCLLPYDELPETEKKYDRATAMETLSFIVNQGYEIRKRGLSDEDNKRSQKK